MQSASMRESRYLHDQLAVISPLLLALSASTPIHKGVVTNTDIRWDVISQAVDDRTANERGTGTGKYIVNDPFMVGNGVLQLSKSRYSSVSMFIGLGHSDEEKDSINELNDIGAEVDDETVSYLTKNGMDNQLANHIAHLFTRDPLVIFNDSIYLEDDKTLEHFENIQSTNWRTIRWKPPAMPKGKELQSSLPGWRVEFRPYEIQLTDFENAAYAIYIVLLTRAILALGMNFMIPMSLVEENMKRAGKMDAALNEKFWFNKRSFISRPSLDFDKDILVKSVSKEDLVELSLNEIINGTPDIPCFPGISSCITNYLEALGCDKEMTSQLFPYIDLINQRSSGKLPTTARWIRNYVKSRPEYSAENPNISNEIANSLIQLCDDVGKGKISCPELYGKLADNRELSSHSNLSSSSNDLFLGKLPGSYNPTSVCCSEQKPVHIESSSECEI